MSDTSNGANQDTVVALRQITKVYPGVVALDRVDLAVHKHEDHDRA